VPAAEAPSPAAVAPQPQPPARPAVQRYDFDDDEVTGEIQAPDEIVVPGRGKVKHASLIEIPGDFVNAVAKSVEDL
jgi:hypothetical protein